MYTRNVRGVSNNMRTPVDSLAKQKIPEQKQFQHQQKPIFTQNGKSTVENNQPQVQKQLEPYDNQYQNDSQGGFMRSTIKIEQRLNPQTYNPCLQVQQKKENTRITEEKVNEYNVVKECNCKEEIVKLNAKLKEEQQKNKDLHRENLKLKHQMEKIHQHYASQQQHQTGGMMNSIEQDEMYSLMLAIRLQEREEKQRQMQQYCEFMKEAMQPQHINSTNDPNYLNTDNMSYEQLLELQDKIGHVSRGLTQEQIQQIPQIKITSLTINKLPDQCTICFCPFVTNEKYRKLKCNHFYHANCIEQWLTSEKKCPICKVEVII